MSNSESGSGVPTAPRDGSMRPEARSSRTRGLIVALVVVAAVAAAWVAVVRPDRPHLKESALDCRDQKFVSMSIDVVGPLGSPEEAEQLAQQGDVYGAETWELIEATPSRFWAGSANGQVVTVFDVVRRDGGWVPDNVRLCVQKAQ